MRKSTGKGFTLYQRANSPYYYAEIKNPKTDKFMPARSTRETDYTAALRVVADWMKNGAPDKHGRAYPISRAFGIDSILYEIKIADLDAIDAGRIVAALEHRGLIDPITTETKQPADSPLFVPWLYEMWDFKESPRIRDMKAHGQKIGRRRCLDMAGAIRAHWEDAFKGKHLHEVTKQELNAFAVTLAESGKSAKTINNVMSAGTVPLRWAAENEVIESDPSKGLKKFSGDKRKRGIMSETEAEKFLSLHWDDERARVGNLLAARMGLRAGEILALRVQDLGTKKLHVRHSWSATDGLKDTKTGDTRNLLWAPGVRAELTKLANANPHGHGPGMYVFYSTLPDRPMDNHVLLDNLKHQFVTLKAGTDATDEKRAEVEETRKERNIVFHSWRHFVAAQLYARGVPMNLAMDYMGHGSQEVFEAYADHETEAGDKILSGAMQWAK